MILVTVVTSGEFVLAPGRREAVGCLPGPAGAVTATAAAGAAAAAARGGVAAKRPDAALRPTLRLCAAPLGWERDPATVAGVLAAGADETSATAVGAAVLTPSTELAAAVTVPTAPAEGLPARRRLCAARRC
jgi:hypothetical protein